MPPRIALPSAKTACVAEEQQRLAAGGPEMRDVRAVQVNVGLGQLGADAGDGQPALAALERQAGDGEAGGEVFRVGGHRAIVRRPRRRANARS